MVQLAAVMSSHWMKTTATISANHWVFSNIEQITVWFHNFLLWSLLYSSPCAYPCQPQCTQSSPTGPHQLPRYDNIPVSLPATEYNWETAGEMFWQNETLHSIVQFVIVCNFSLSNEYTLSLFQMSYLFQEIASSNATVVFIGPRRPASTRSSLSSQLHGGRRGII